MPSMKSTGVLQLHASLQGYRAMNSRRGATFVVNQQSIYAELNLDHM